MGKARLSVSQLVRSIGGEPGQDAESSAIKAGVKAMYPAGEEMKSLCGAMGVRGLGYIGGGSESFHLRYILKVGRIRACRAGCV